MNTLEILQRWGAGYKPNLEAQKFLLAQELALPEKAQVFGITTSNGLEIMVQRNHLFQAISSGVVELCQSLNCYDPEQTLLTLWNFWLPWTMLLVQKKTQLNRPFIQGILGGQGTGKTTLAEVTKLILQHQGYSTVSISIDDIYKTYEERQKLQEQDNRLIWRGPPGTHDVDLGIELLDNLRRGEPDEIINVPRFDKSAYGGAGDRTKSEQVSNIDIVLFEGWFVGVRPIPQSAFNEPPAPIITLEDKKFAQDMNVALRAYLPLWERLDSLLVLHPVDYRFSKQWRQEAERKMIALGKSGMSDGEIGRFVDYFWQALHPELFIEPLVNSPWVDMVVEIDASHLPGKIYGNCS